MDWEGQGGRRSESTVVLQSNPLFLPQPPLQSGFDFEDVFVLFSVSPWAGISAREGDIHQGGTSAVDRTV